MEQLSSEHATDTMSLESILMRLVLQCKHSINFSNPHTIHHPKIIVLFLDDQHYCQMLNWVKDLREIKTIVSLSS